MIRENHEGGAEWGPISRMCRSVMAELPSIAATVEQFIREEVPAYEIVADSEHRYDVEGQLRNKLMALAERRPPSPEELSAVSVLAAKRAGQGIPIDALIAAYQAGDREIWRLAMERGEPAMAALMPELGRRMFEATSATTEVMARAHSRVARDIDGDRISLVHRLLDLVGDPNSGPEAAVTATQLGLRPADDFVGIVWLPDAGAEFAAHDIATALRDHGIDLVARPVAGGQLEMLAQGAAVDTVTTLVTSLLRGRVGIGVGRRGLSGAAMSLGDARLAVQGCTPAQPVVRFEDEWPVVVILAQKERLQRLTRAAIEIAQANTHLAETVMAFADADMSIARTAARAHLHPNSVSYRLDRWSRLTGWDPRSFRGLVRSVTACRLAAEAPTGFDSSPSRTSPTSV